MGKGIETERKFVIVRPDAQTLCRQEGYTVSRITQTYLQSEPSVTHRVRKREYDDNIAYTETKKIRLSPLSAIEEECEIDEATYKARLTQKKEGTRPVKKTRHTFRYGSHTVEIDVYPEWKKSCILEVELPSEDTPLSLPSFVEVIREVTGDRTYSNASMSKNFPKELPFPSEEATTK